MLGNTNHVAKKYHIEFRVAESEIVKIGTGPSCKLILKVVILTEVEAYTHIGEMLNNGWNLSAQ